MLQPRENLFGETRGIVRRYLWVALPVFALTAATVTVAALWIEPQYTATSTVFVRFGREFLYRPEIGPAEHPKAFELKEMVNTEVEIIASRDLASEVVDALTVESLYPQILLAQPDAELARQKAISAFQDGLIVLPVLESSVIRVSFSHLDPELAATALNRLTEAFLDKHIELFREESPRFIGQKLEEWRGRLTVAEDALHTLEEENGVVDHPRQIELLLEQEAALRTSLSAQEATRAGLAFQRDSLRALAAGEANGDAAPVLETVAMLQERRDIYSTELSQALLRLAEIEHELAAILGGDPAIVPAVASEDQSVEDAYSRLLELELEKRRLLHSYRPDSRKVRSISEEIEGVGKFLVERARTVQASADATSSRALSVERTARLALRDGIIEKIEEIDHDIRRRQLADIEAQWAVGESQRQITLAQIEEIRTRIRELDRVAQRIDDLVREQEISEANYRIYLQKHEEALIHEELDRQKLSSVRVLERAVRPIEPSGLSPKLKIAFGLVAGVLAGVGAAVALELLRGETARR